MALAIFDSGTGVFAYGLAGHPPPLLRLEATGAVVALTGAAGPALGPIPGAAYTEGAEQLQPGDVVLLYTDGLVERHDRDIDAGIAAAERIVAGWGPGVSLAGGSVALHEAVAPRPRVGDVCSVGGAGDIAVVTHFDWEPLAAGVYRDLGDRGVRRPGNRRRLRCAPARLVAHPPQPDGRACSASQFGVVRQVLGLGRA